MQLLVEKDTNLRIDKYLTFYLTDLSRQKIQKLIEKKEILVNNQLISSNYKVKEGDIITISNNLPTNEIELKPSNIPLDIIYEDDDLLVINKQSGLVVHPAPGNYEDTLVNALIGKYNLSNNNIRPGIVHRLDKDTSGLILIAKNDYIHNKLSQMIKNRKVERYYLALVEGTFNHETGTIEAPIGRDFHNREKMTVTSVNSKNAITHFKVVTRYLKYTLIECKLETGRTHQIRVHLSYIKHPVVGDPLYGKKTENSNFGQLLHAYKIHFPHPRTNKILEFQVEPPEEFFNILNDLTN